MSDDMENFPWTLDFTFAEFTPREVEQITTLSVGMQRDWRQRGYLPKSDKHARFDATMISEIWTIKMFADRGIGPARSSSKSYAIAGAVVLAALTIRDDAWGGERPANIFDQIPQEARVPTPSEERGEEPDDYEKRGWLATCALGALGFKSINRSGHVIWWPTDAVQFGDYGHIAGSTLDAPPDDRIDQRFDGAAIVLGVDYVAENLVRKASRPLLRAALMLDSSIKVPKRGLRYNLGQVRVAHGKL